VLTLQQAVSSDTSATPQSDVLQMQLVGSNAQAQSVALSALESRSNYLVGSDPSKWRMNVPNYGQVENQNVYAGVDVIDYGNQGNLEYDFIVAPGADAGAIRLGFQGAEHESIDSQGNLVLQMAGGEVIEHAPVVYQEIAGVRRSVLGRYELDVNGQVG